MRGIRTKVICLVSISILLTLGSAACKRTNVKSSGDIRYPATALAETEKEIEALQPHYNHLQANINDWRHTVENYEGATGGFVNPGHKQDYQTAVDGIKEYNRVKVRMMELEDRRVRCQQALEAQHHKPGTTGGIGASAGGDGGGDGGGY
jgi:hypothetical protein